MVKETLVTDVATPSTTKLMNEIEENLSTFDSIEKVLGPIEEERRRGGKCIRKLSCKSQK